MSFEALERRKPILGICLGMQLFANSSSEHGSHTGLGWIDGTVRAFASRKIEGLAVPHMGWNDVSPATGNPLFRDLES